MSKVYLGSCVQLYTLAETLQLPPPSPRIWAHIRGAILVSQDRRHLFVIPCYLPLKLICEKGWEVMRASAAVIVISANIAHHWFTAIL
jgi:hypothetical protein